MPQVAIHLLSSETYKAAAGVFSVLAYPDYLSDELAMALRHAVLCHLYLRARAAADDKWQRSPQSIKPLYWLCDPRFVGQVDRELRRRIRDRMAAARMVIPFLQEAEGSNWLCAF